MSTQLRDLNTKWLVEVILKNQNVESVDNVDLQIQSAVPEGDNFCSDIYGVKLKCQSSAGKKINISSICKRAPKEGFCDDFADMFATEIKVYSTVLPLMSDLMSEFSDSREKLWCSLYGKNGNDTLLFEDLTESGFTTYPRVDWLSEPDTKFIMKELGRFHAMSRILLERGSFRKDDYPRNNLGSDSPIWGKLYEGPMILLGEAMAEFWGSEWEDLAYLVKKQVPVVCDKVTHLANNYDSRYDVFNHGDLWSCNIMKKCENVETGDTSSIKFIDFQRPSINSFIMDVAMILHCSVDPSIRRDKFDAFLAIYAESLGENLRFFNSKSYRPSLDDVISEYERIAYLSFVFGVTFLASTTSTTSEPLRIDKVHDHPAEEIYDKNAFVDQRIVRELKEDLKLFEKQLL